MSKAAMADKLDNKEAWIRIQQKTFTKWYVFESA